MRAVAQQDETAWDYHGFSRMYERLVIYGLCYLRSGPGRHKRIIEWETDRIPERRQWTAVEVEVAGRLHSRIIRLPLRHNLVIQVFFGESCAAYWPEISPFKQQDIVRDLTQWPAGPPGVNARIRRANLEWNWNVPTISPDDFLTIRDRAIRMLCNSEKLVHVAQTA